MCCVALPAGDGAGFNGEVAAFASVVKGGLGFGDALGCVIVALPAGRLFRAFVREKLSLVIKEVVAEGAGLLKVGGFVVGVVIEPGEGAGAWGVHALFQDRGKGPSGDGKGQGECQQAGPGKSGHLQISMVS